MKNLNKEKIREKIKELKEYVVVHKVASMSVAGALAAVIVTIVIVTAVLGMRSSDNTVAGVETQDETTETMQVVALADKTTEEETTKTEEVVETQADTSMEFEYDGKKIVISTDKPVELIPEEELSKKVEKDKSTTVIGGDVTVDNPDTGEVKEPEKKENYEIIVDNSEKKEVYAGEVYAPLAGVRVGELDNSSASDVGFTITDESGNIVKKMTSDEIKNYNGNPEDITVVFDKPGTYNVKYEFTAPGVRITEAVHGIDVSHWQNDIDWGAVAAEGYKFAMIKVAGRSIADDGNLYEDDYFRKNIQEATANGIQVGVYFFSQALNVQEAYEEASYILNLIKGYNITYPVAFDWETTRGYRTCDKLNADELTSICEAFCDTVKSHGYQPMIYMSKSDWVNRVHTNTLASKYNVWLAWYFYKYYNVAGNSRYERDYYQDGDEVPDLDFTYNIWQYTSTGGVAGVGGNCDKNVAFATSYKPGDTITKNISVKVLKKQEETTKEPGTTSGATESDSKNDKESESTTESGSKKDEQTDTAASTKKTASDMIK